MGGGAGWAVGTCLGVFVGVGSRGEEKGEMALYSTPNDKEVSDGRLDYLLGNIPTSKPRYKRVSHVRTE